MVCKYVVDIGGELFKYRVNDCSFKVGEMLKINGNIVGLIVNKSIIEFRNE